MIAVRTPRGVVTGYRVLWLNAQNRPVYTWMTDRDAEPHDFGTVEAATAWINEVWCCASTAREKRDKAAWTVEEVTREAEASRTA